MNGLSFTELLHCLAWSSAPLNFNFLFKLLIHNMPRSVVLCLFQCWAMRTEIRCINIRTYCNLYWLFSRKAYKVCLGYNSCREVVIILMTGKEPCWEHFPWVFSICGSLYPGFWKCLRCLPWMFILSLLLVFGIFIKNLKHSYIFIKNFLLAYGKKLENMGK